jgi:hypothetical protein
MDLQRGHLSMISAEEQVNILCALCCEVEKTMHLLYECARSSEPLWELAKEAITAVTAQTYQIHAHSAIYNIYDGQFQWQHASQFMAWFQEIKKDLIYRRFKRCKGRTIQPGWPRLLGYLINIQVAWSHYTIIRDEMALT